MKGILKQLVQKMLAALAKIWLMRKKPKIIGITGSVGKTTIKEAVYTVLSSRFAVKKSAGSYNTDFGMPLAILGLSSGYSSFLAWVGILAQALWRAFFDPAKVDILILEMGVDKPRDMDNLLAMVKPDIAIFANVKPVHLAAGQFKNLDAIFMEKIKLVQNLGAEAHAILNIDDVRVKKIVDQLPCKVVSYSAFNDVASFYAKDIETTENGLQFWAHYQGQKVQVELPILGEHHVYAILPAFACGTLFGMELAQINEALKNFDLPPGRMNILAGINGSVLIDSSYNASPDATFEALKVLKKAGERAHRRIAVLGNMNELGEFTEHEHRRIGKKVPECCDLLIAVGEYTKFLCEEAANNGLREDRVYWFSNVHEAKNFLKDKVENGDMILLKGSQNNVRLEILVKELLRDQAQAATLLVRQGKEWQNVI